MPFSGRPSFNRSSIFRVISVVRVMIACTIQKEVSPICYWSLVYIKETTDEAHNILLSSLTRIHENCFSYKQTEKSKKSRKPQVTPELVHKININNNLFKKIIKNRDLSQLCDYKSFRNKLNSELKHAKLNYYNRNILWKLINYFIKPVEKCSRYDTELDGSKLPDFQLATNFNNYFVNLVQPANYSIDPSVTSRYVPNESTFFPTTISEVISMFLNLKNC